MIHQVCAVLTTAASVAVAWPHLRPAVQRARQLAAGAWDRLPGPPSPGVRREPTRDEIAAVTPSYYRPEDWT